VIEKTYTVVTNVLEGTATPFYKALELMDMKWAENAGANVKYIRVLDNRQEKNLQKYIFIYAKIKPKQILQK
jgi:hypothetical protein